MGFDVINFNPSIISGAGPQPINPGNSADYWDFSGSTRLSGLIDPGPRTPVQVGAAISLTPTLAAVQNTTSGINQVIALINYRGSDYATRFAGSFTPIAYLQPGQPFTTANLQTIQTAINAVRTLEGFTTYAFTFVPGTLVGTYQLGAAVAELRKALRISGKRTLFVQSSGFHQYIRNDAPFGTVSTPAPSIVLPASIGSPFTNIGINGITPTSTRHRMLLAYPVPSYLLGLPGGTSSLFMNSSCAGVSDSPALPLVFSIWASDSSDFPPTIAGNAHSVTSKHIIYSASLPTPPNLYGGSAQIGPMTDVYMNAQAGFYFSMVLAMQDEALNIAPSANGAWEVELASSVFLPQLIADFGN